MAISHDIGLFIPFKFNRSLTKEEKQSRFIQGKRRKVSGEATVLDLDTVIRMNSSYLEVVDKFYPTKGYVASFMMAFCILYIVYCFLFWLLQKSLLLLVMVFHFFVLLHLFREGGSAGLVDFS